jgi:bifunctional DNase/RNase
VWGPTPWSGKKGLPVSKVVSVAGITIDPETKSPIVLLRDSESGDVLPILIGLLEANAIVFALEGTELPRPMTHDLLISILHATGTRIGSVEISDVRDSTYFAVLNLEFLEGNGESVRIDARPSDAIALAVRCGARILVSETVLSKSSVRVSAPIEGVKKENRDELLETMDPGQFSKYKM